MAVTSKNSSKLLTWIPHKLASEKISSIEIAYKFLELEV